MRIKINAHGMTQIATWLRKKHRNGEEIAKGSRCMAAWAATAEAHYADGTSAWIEIRPDDSISGKPEVFDVSRRGYNIVAATAA